MVSAHRNNLMTTVYLCGATITFIAAIISDESKSFTMCSVIIPMISITVLFFFFDCC